MTPFFGKQVSLLTGFETSCGKFPRREEHAAVPSFLVDRY